MLRYGAVEPGTLDVLRLLMALPELEHFNLVGGTALALYYEHRLSVDLDLFSTEPFSNEVIVHAIEKAFPDFSYGRPNAVGIFGFIGSIKVDLIQYHHHPMINSIAAEDGIRLVSKEDIIAMEVAAILKRAVKKDFWDMAELLDHYTMDDVVRCYHQKYPTHQLLISIPQALSYFAEADESEDAVSLKGQTWTTVKERIQDKIDSYLK